MTGLHRRFQSPFKVALNHTEIALHFVEFFFFIVSQIGLGLDCKWNASWKRWSIGQPPSSGGSLSIHSISTQELIFWGGGTQWTSQNRILKWLAAVKKQQEIIIGLLGSFFIHSCECEFFHPQLSLTSQSIRRKSMCFEVFCGKCRKPITEVDDGAGSGRVGTSGECHSHAGKVGPNAWDTGGQVIDRKASFNAIKLKHTSIKSPNRTEKQGQVAKHKVQTRNTWAIKTRRNH